MKSIRQSLCVLLTATILAPLVSGCSKAPADDVPSAPVPFVSAHFVVPLLLEKPAFTLRPIRQTDAERDYEAVIASAELLRKRFGQDWPSDDFTVNQNRQQLAIHEQQFATRQAFVFTVIRPDSTYVLGCVYIVPDASQLNDAVVIWWTRPDANDEDLKHDLHHALETWLDTHWPFQKVRFDGPD